MSNERSNLQNGANGKTPYLEKNLKDLKKHTPKYNGESLNSIWVIYIVFKPL